VETREFFSHYARMLGRERVPTAPTPVVLAIATVLDRAGRMRGANPEVTPAAVRYLCRSGTYSIEKARAALGYDPSVDLAEGMRRCEEWLRAEGVLERS
jgi:nucleoside-diphosphate-sugar epimerase